MRFIISVIFMIIFLCLSSMDLLFLSGSGGVNQDWAWAIDTDLNGNFFISGSASGNVIFDNIELNDLNQDTPIVAKINNYGQYEWVRHFVPASFDENMIIGTGMGVAVDSEDNVYFSGYFNGSVMIDETTLTSNGLWDVFLVKLSNDGDILWAKSFGGEGYDIAHGMSINRTSNIEEDIIYLTGWFGADMYIDDVLIPNLGGSDIFVAKFNANGDLLECIYSGNEQVNYSYQISSGQNNSFSIIGSSGGEIELPDLGFVNFDAPYLYHYNPENQNTYLATVNCVSPYRVFVDGDNSSYMAGKLLGQAVVAGETFVNYNGTEDGFLAKSSGNSEDNWDWALVFQGSGTDVVRAVCTDQDDNVYIALTFSDSLSVFGYDFFTDTGEDLIVMKLSPNGNYLNHLLLQGNGSVKITDMKHNNSFNHLVLTGWYNGDISHQGHFIETSNFYDRDIVFIKISTDESNNISDHIEDNLQISINDKFYAYPNPLTSNVLNISFKEVPVKQSQLFIYNTKGQKVLTKDLTGKEISFDISDLSNGLYILKVKDAISTSYKRITVIK